MELRPAITACHSSQPIGREEIELIHTVVVTVALIEEMTNESGGLVTNFGWKCNLNCANSFCDMSYNRISHLKPISKKDKVKELLV